MNLTLGSLFDGSGGFPLAGSLSGIEPKWASEIEPYPIAVTRSRFPNMKHLGNIMSINGAEIEPVDIVSFGSPCQDLSVAGKRAGLKHSENGDEETTRSGLFMEAVRIIKEMRAATGGKYPRYALWENVPGAFSSQKGEDFRVVLEELIKIVEPNAVMPQVPAKGWAYADCYSGDGWSIAYRVLDAQYIRTAQRRRRIYLIADFGGQCAREILFERDCLRGHSAQSGTERKDLAANVERGVGTADCERKILNLNSGNNQPWIAYPIENHHQDSRVKIDENGVVQTLSGRMGTGGNNVPMVMQPFCKSTRARSSDDATTWKEGVVANTINTFDMGETRANELVVQQVYESHPQDSRIKEVDEVSPTVSVKWHKGAADTPLVVKETPTKYHYIVRRLTPTECARLQGFPDKWGHPDIKENLTDEEWAFWMDVRNTAAEINGKAVKEYTREQMLNWYNKLHTDSSEYKMWGNGIALPCAQYVMEGIAEVARKEKAALSKWLDELLND